MNIVVCDYAERYSQPDNPASDYIISSYVEITANIRGKAVLIDDPSDDNMALLWDTAADSGIMVSKHSGREYRYDKSDYGWVLKVHWTARMKYIFNWFLQNA
jgi:hypothetical protein